LLHLALVAPETGEADCGEEFLVSARNTFPLSQHLAVVTSVLFPRDAMKLSLKPPFLVVSTVIVASPMRR
jgi:hypothetical protein